MPLSHTETFSSTSNEDIFYQLLYSVKSIYKKPARKNLPL